MHICSKLVRLLVGRVYVLFYLYNVAKKFMVDFRRGKQSVMQCVKVPRCNSMDMDIYAC